MRKSAGKKNKSLKRISLSILPQPDDITCGPTALHSIYNYYGDTISLGQIIREVKMLEEGGTLAVMLANHALKRGYEATIHTFNLNIFDPTWFKPKAVNLISKLEKQYEVKHTNRKLRIATRGYIDFLKNGGTIKFEDLTPALIRKYLNAKKPILTGLSSTYLYQSERELPDSNQSDDIRGYPSGHFVVLGGYDKKNHNVFVLDPYQRNPLFSHEYLVSLPRLVCSILLGILTYDANLLIISKPQEKHEKPHSRR